MCVYIDYNSVDAEYIIGADLDTLGCLIDRVFILRHLFETCFTGPSRYAETWDFVITQSTFLQFELAMGCSGTFSDLFDVYLEFSTDMGLNWSPVVDACLPPELDCMPYVLESTYSSESFANWTRISMHLPAKAMLVSKFPSTQLSIKRRLSMLRLY